MRHDEFLKTVTEKGGPSDREQASKLVNVVLEDLGKRLKGGEASNLAAQLPQELKAPLTDHAGTETLDDVDEFLRRVAGKLEQGVGTEDALAQVKAVFSTLADSVSEGEIKDLRSQLPTGFAPLFA
ncbi:DUF2267 domain-containing protein [Nesterenkonia aurantiaca]|uniref:Uncharacterized protein (DUF2267 family) n=1 Tax=Nesterenkonia aurantiaca TaxID=1436010 RepID=A0A4R7G6B2_9MICC|nr:DUF2267 domain-containing protein [Nesterenkonia aurantiaca]TDS86877.1 uncharacterized protein (DUF2267 family) [Nesterenkonia aurantiaca]